MPLALQQPRALVAGIDARPESLWGRSRRSVPNLLFVGANAAVPLPELHGSADAITVNFPFPCAGISASSTSFAFPAE